MKKKNNVVVVGGISGKKITGHAPQLRNHPYSPTINLELTRTPYSHLKPDTTSDTKLRGYAVTLLLVDDITVTQSVNAFNGTD
jgi:hypothetical protein